MSLSTIARNRLNKELGDLDRDPPPGITCYPVEDDITQLEAFIKGPPDSPYEKGMFQLEIRVPYNYPMEPPQIRFKTPIYHPNIDDNGRICADILKAGGSGTWGPALNLSTTLILLSTLMASPNPDDPLVKEIAHEFSIDHARYVANARAHTEKYAMGTSASAAAKTVPEVDSASSNVKAAPLLSNVNDIPTSDNAPGSTSISDAPSRALQTETSFAMPIHNSGNNMSPPAPKKPSRLSLSSSKRKRAESQSQTSETSSSAGMTQEEPSSQTPFAKYAEPAQIDRSAAPLSQRDASLSTDPSIETIVAADLGSIQSQSSLSSKTEPSPKTVAETSQSCESVPQAKKLKKTSLLSRISSKKETRDSPSSSSSSLPVLTLQDIPTLVSKSDTVYAPIPPPPLKKVHSAPSSSANAWSSSRIESDQEQRMPVQPFASNPDNVFKDDKDAPIIAADTRVQAQAEDTKRVPMTETHKNCSVANTSLEEVPLFPVTHEKSIQPKKSNKLSLSKSRRQKQQQQQQQQQQ